MNRRPAVAADRDGGRCQFVERPVPVVLDGSFAPLLDRARGHIGEPRDRPRAGRAGGGRPATPNRGVST